MNRKEYTKELMSPQWAKRREEILERDGRKCVFCGSTENLNVHHLEYMFGVRAWEYPDNKLITLCRYCHSKEHRRPLNIKPELAVMCFYGHNYNYFQSIGGKAYVLLYALIRCIEYDTGMIYLTKNRRAKICNDIDITTQALSACINELKDAFVISGDSGEYMINPVLFWYGKIETRTSMLLSTEIQEMFNFKIEN